jgi:23S rRNA (uracil1939-C5)-methyltransferase
MSEQSTEAPRRIARGEVVEMTIDALAHGGAGVGRVDGFVVFARGGLPGDVVRVEITSGKKRFAEGRVIELLTAGPDRVPLRAPHPGAMWQGFDYPAQLVEKQRQVREALERFGGFDLSEISIEPIVAAGESHEDPAIWNYRNKVEFSFGLDENGELALGYHRPGHWDVIEDVDDVVLASARTGEIRRIVKAFCERSELSPWDPDENFGFLRNLVVREGRATGQTMVRLVTSSAEPELGLDTAGLVDALGALDPPISSLIWTRSDSPGNWQQGARDKLLLGSPTIEERILGLTFRISPDAFFQTNSAQTERLYATASEFAALTGRERVFDLYCGSGTIGIALAEHAREVHGIELVEAAIADAEANANINGVVDAEFIAGDVRLALPELTERFGRPDLVIVDPPRAGLSQKVVRRIIEAGPSRVLYVSCNPDTLAPNARQLADAGYSLRRVRPVDMFPHTPHIETVAMLDLTDDAKRLAAIAARLEERRAKQKKR